MKKSNHYSDEYINAYIDGELDTEDRAGFLFDEQDDAQLALRVNEARILKEKVQLAYVDVVNDEEIANPLNCTDFIRRHRSLVASFFVVMAIAAMITLNINNDNNVSIAKRLITSTQAISGNLIDTTVGSNQRVIIHLSQYQQNHFSKTFDNIESLLEQRRSEESFSVEIVANGDGLKALDVSSSIYAERLSALAQRYDALDVVACAKSMAKLESEGDPIQLMTSIMIVPSTAQQVAKRTNQGWLYLKV